MELGERAKFVKAMLGLLMEITSDRDSRMGFEGATSGSLQFCTMMVSLTQSCLVIIRDLNLNDRMH